MNYLNVFILSIVEGLTEFLPVSSTFHLIHTSKILGLANTDFLKTFEVIIQSGAILAALVLYFKKLQNIQVLKNVFFSFLPTSIVGFVLYKLIKSFFFENFTLQLGVFLFVGVIFLIYEKWFIKTATKNIANLTTQNAIILGLAQALAVIPGVSRAGAVLLCGLILGYKREEVAEYSFLLAVPTILAAGALDIAKNYSSLSMYSDSFGQIAFGITISFLSAYIVIRWFIGYLQKNTLEVFGWYRVILSFLLLFLGF